jgi:hypothetical protein
MRGGDIRECECRACGEVWYNRVYAATYYEPSDCTQPDCPDCGGHDTECDCEDCRKPPAKRGMAWVKWKRGQMEGK